MKKPIGLKFILDIVLAVSFLFLMDEWSLLGIRFHEIAGLAVFGLFLFHKYLNWGFIKSTALGFFGKAPARNRVLLILDVLLLVGFILITLSGMAIAKTIDFSWLGLKRTIVWRFLHTASALTILLVVGVHVGLHWSWVRARLPKINLKPAIGKAAALLAAAAVIAGAAYFEGKVRFVERTGMSYGIVFGGGKNMPARPGGGPQSVEPGNGRQKRGEEPQGPEQGNQARERRPEGPRGARSMFSLQKVIPYAFILMLFAIISRFTDYLIARAAASKRPA